jgi:hypothetical protein
MTDPYAVAAAREGASKEQAAAESSDPQRPHPEVRTTRFAGTFPQRCTTSSLIRPLTSRRSAVRARDRPLGDSTSPRRAAQGRGPSADPTGKTGNSCFMTAASVVGERLVRFALSCDAQRGGAYLLGPEHLGDRPRRIWILTGEKAMRRAVGMFRLQASCQPLGIGSLHPHEAISHPGSWQTHKPTPPRSAGG